jgi:hypothetical protein
MVKFFVAARAEELRECQLVDDRYEAERILESHAEYTAAGVPCHCKIWKVTVEECPA